MTELRQLEKDLLRHTGRAIADYRMIREGDRVLVGVSGGKDSWTLLHLLRTLQRKAPVRFEILAVNLDQGDPGFDAARIERFLREDGYDYRMVRQEVHQIVRATVPAGKSLCSFCSRLRRGILYTQAPQLGCNRIALGHHADDLFETLLLNLFFAGQLKSMAPWLHADDGRNVVIRPLIYAREAQIARYAELRGFPIVPCGICATGEDLQRRRIKRLLASLEEEIPGIRGSMLAALGNVRSTHLLDRSLLAALGQDGWQAEPTLDPGHGAE